MFIAPEQSKRCIFRTHCVLKEGRPEEAENRNSRPPTKNNVSLVKTICYYCEKNYLLRLAQLAQDKHTFSPIVQCKVIHKQIKLYHFVPSPSLGASSILPFLPCSLAEPDPALRDACLYKFPRQRVVAKISAKTTATTKKNSTTVFLYSFSTRYCCAMPATL